MSSHFRIIDANLNRLKEGVRVVEDILRYEFNTPKIVLELKTIRHDCIIENTKEYISSRDTDTDCLKDISTASEITKHSLDDIVTANIKRAQESARVLEEIFKLYSKDNSNKFKQIRYKLYKIEKTISKVLQQTNNH